MQPYPPIVALAGYATVGKSTAARVLRDDYGFRILSFATTLKQMAIDGYMIDGRMWWWDGVSKGPTERAAFQYIGDRERAKNPLVFIWPVLHELGKKAGPCVIDDARLPNEFVNLIERRAVIWRVTNPAIGPVNGHHSETAHLRFAPHAIIRNDVPTLDNLRREIDEAVSGL